MGGTGTVPRCSILSIFAAKMGKSFRAAAAGRSQNPLNKKIVREILSASARRLFECPGLSSLRRTRSTFSGVTTVGTHVEEFLGRTLPC